MKLMLISDIHGSASALEKALALAEQQVPDKILLLGDLLNHGPRNALPEGYDPIRVAELLNQNASKMIAVRGNCDSEVDQMLINFPVLAEFSQVLLPERQIFLSHGHIWSPEKLPLLNSGDIFCFGHTHIPLIECRDGIIIFNPGSISIPRNQHVPSVGWIEPQQLKITSLQGDLLVDLPLND
ncbi:phosphodiesterase [Pelagibaculum spongiae]|uniref:Phosphoesterase n=1 Tax=Pelagibaculum spongiae TaxID=2080658 RepID=A0A2V1GXX2_9GAMM|nr:phosphodiesterase [Pelagibaculum spongiae]PVZ65394.1 phosphodiesterase [Pelagibaculum spongiae]